MSKFIWKEFRKIAPNIKTDVVVEKTTANSLRVGFVDHVFPDAKFVFIVRDGHDVVASALKRWAAPLDLPYILSKARYVPLSDIPYYGSRYFLNRIYRLVSTQDRLATWGPRFRGMDDALRNYSLHEVCAIQWARCVERSESELDKLSKGRVYRLRYEDFVTRPRQEISALAEFLAIRATNKELDSIALGVRNSSVGKGKTELPRSVLDSISPIVEPLRNRFGYD